MGAEPELRTFLRGEIAGADFRHADHVRMGFEVLRRHDFLDAARAYAAAIKSMAARAGNPGAYHETITIGFLALIAERMAAGTSETFEEFAAANADLFDKQVLMRWYGAERLGSALARRTLCCRRCGEPRWALGFWPHSSN
jgi:hypothetical protein